MKKSGIRDAGINSSVDVNKFNEDLINTVREPLLVLDKDLRVLNASRSFYDFFNVTPDDTVDKLIYDLGNHQWDIPKLKELLETILPKKTIFDNYEVEHNFSSIGRRIMLLNARQIKRGLGKEKIILLAFEDVTERKREEKSLSEKSRLTNEYLNILLDHAHAPIIIWDSSLIIKRFNLEFEKLSGYSKSEVEDRKIEMLFPKNEIASTLELIKNNIGDENPKIIEINILTKDKKIKTVLWNSANISSEEGGNTVATIAQDITYRIRTETMLSESEKKTKALLVAFPDMIFRIDREGTFLDYKADKAGLYDQSGETIIGKKNRDIIPPEIADLVDRYIRLTLDSGVIQEFEYQMENPKHGLRNYEARMVVSGKDEVIAIIRDITEHKQLEKEKEILTYNLNERVKELTCLYSISSIIEIDNISSDEMFKEIVRMIPSGWKYPDITCARIVIGKNEYKTTNYNQTKWKHSSDIKVDGTISGFIEVFYLKEISGIDEGPFLKEEINLLNLIAGRLGHVIERKQAEKELIKAKEKAEEDEAKFRELFSSVADAIFIFNPDNLEILEANKATSALYGYSHDELIGMSALKLSAEVEESKSVAKIIKTRKQVNVELRNHKKKDGTDLFVEVNNYNISVNEKNIFYAVIHDLTNIKKTETELLKAKEKSEESEARLRDAQRIANIGHWSLDLKTERVEMSDQMLVLLGLKDKKEALEVSNHEKYYTPESWLRLGKALETIRTTGKNYEMEMEFSDKNAKFRYAVARGEAIYGKSNKIIGIKGTLQDITERKKLETSLKEREEFLNRTGEISKVGGWQLVDNFTRVEWTKTTGDIHELPEGVYPSLEEAINYYHPDDRDKVIKSVYNAIEKGKPYDFETRLITAKGNLRWVRLIGRAEMEKGKIVRISGTIQDYTELKKIEQELIIAKDKAEESDRLKSAFLANMSHEIRTPMNGILGFIELLKEPKLSGEEQQEFIGFIEKSGARMLNIINNIIAISMIESEKIDVTISDININDQVEDIFNFFKQEAEQKKLHLSFKTPLSDKEAKIRTDKEKINSVLINLVKNAITFTHSGSIEFGYVRKNHSLEYFVKDTGIGISPKQMKIIFERFRQGSEFLNRKYEGAGLGLSISKAYVEILGGKIWVESNTKLLSTKGDNDENGTTFFFTIPIHPVKIGNADITIINRDNVIENQKRKLKILIVEDDEVSELLIEIVLNNSAREILKAYNGIEAVDMCRNNPDIDLVMMDIKMPVMDGYEATRKIREFNKKVLIIAQTAYANTSDREMALAAGCNDYISKPINPLAFRKLISDYFILNETNYIS